MHDTAIYDLDTWTRLSDLTVAIDREPGIARRMDQRVERLEVFTRYLRQQEDEVLSDVGTLPMLHGMARVGEAVRAEALLAQRRAHRYYD